MRISPTNFSRYPLLYLSVCFAFGIAAANFFDLNRQIPLAVCLLCGFSAAFSIKRKYASVFLFAAFFSLGAFWLQAEKDLTANHRIKRIYDENRIASGEPVEIEGVLKGKPELTATGFLLDLNAENLIYKGAAQKVSGRVRLYAFVETAETAEEYARLDLESGTRLRAACYLEREERFLNPGVVSGRQILDQQQIDATAVLKSPLLLEKIGEQKRFAPLAWIYERRQNLIVEFRARFDYSTAGVLIASLLGNKHFLDRRTAELFREGGTFHVLVISGLHITFIGGLTLFLLRFFTKKRFWQFVIAGALLWSYALAVGADVPVVRAALMFTILLFSQVVFRRGTLLNSLGFCALVLLLLNPEDLFNPSFQLTFTSVAALIAGAFPIVENLRSIGNWTPTAENPFPPDVSVWLKRFCETLYWREKIWETHQKQQIWSANLFKSPNLKWIAARNLQTLAAWTFEGILVSLIVQIWLLPLLVFYFHRISFASIWLNLWVGFFIALETFAALLAVFFAQASTNLALPFVKLTEVFNALLLFLPQLFVGADYAGFRVPVYAGEMKIVYFLYFAPLLVLSVLLDRWNPFDLKSTFRAAKTQNGLRFALFLLIVFAGVIIFHPLSRPTPDASVLRIDFLDVGQGDSIFVQFPNGETLLVDAGGKTNFRRKNIGGDAEDEAFEPDSQGVGERVVSEFLWERGFSLVDYILATHADADHIQGLTDVARNFRVRAAFFGRTPDDDEDFSELSGVLKLKKIPAMTLARGDLLTFGEVTVEVLYPEADASPDAVSDNNHSLVLRINYGAKKILLTGDIERETEEFLVRNPSFLRADIVKVAHHGSRTSSTPEFVAATGAEYAIIPIGRRSRFGHPHEEVVERWKNAKAKIYTTGERGTVSISTDGRNLEIQTFKK